MKTKLFFLTSLLLSFSLVLSTAFAYTLDNGVCEGEDAPFVYMFPFDNLFYINRDCSEVSGCSSNIKTTTYNPNINVSAFQFSSGGNVLEGVYFSLDIVGAGFNQTIGVDVNTIKFDLYNSTFSNLGLMDMWVHFINETEGISYSFNFQKGFDSHNNLNQDEQEIVYYRENHFGCHSDWLNGTEIANYDYGDGCPYELLEIDWLNFNMPYGGNQPVSWNFDFTIDNMRVGREENEYTSRDCSVIYSSFSDIEFKRHYGTVEVVAGVGQEGVQSYESRLINVLPSYSKDLSITVLMSPDGSLIPYGNFEQNQLLMFMDYYNYNDSGIVPSDMIGQLINISCEFELGDSQYPSEIFCKPALVNSLTPFDVSSLLDNVIYTGDKEQLPFSIIKNRYSDYSISSINYYTRYNDTHTVYYSLPSWTPTIQSKYYYYDLGLETDTSLIDEAWDYIGNYTAYRYQLTSPDSDGTITVYSTTRRDDIENYEGNDLIISGYGGTKYVFFDDQSNYTTIDYVEANGVISMVNVVGNGECETLESSLESSWNYSPDCYSDMGVGAIMDGIGNIFQIFNQTAVLGGASVASMNTTDNTSTLGNIGILIILIFGLVGIVGYVRGGK